MTFWHVLVFFALAVTIKLSSTEIVIGLNSSKVAWTVRNLNNSVRCKSNVPGGIYSDLQKADILGESVLYRYNDVAYRWVGNDSWLYETYFDVPHAYLSLRNLFLVFHGLHTVSKIYLNKVLIGSTDNMFVRYRIDVKDHLKDLNNKLEVFLESPIKAAMKAHKKSKYPIPPVCPPANYNGECHANMLRMKQDSFGWDWGPAVPNLGIWKNVDLELYDTAVVRDITTHLEKGSSSWTLKVQSFLESSLRVKGELTATLFAKNQNISKTVPWDNAGEANTTIELQVPLSEVDLWWPNGFGDHPLYKLEVLFKSGKETSKKSINIGFRTLVLMQDRIDITSIEKGLSFYFLVNDVPIFAKGSNLIPTSVFPEEDENTQGYVEHLLQSAVDVHMNMLRVWGGGIYESTSFYELCDRLGIMIWQDLMFACSMYSSDSKFLANVATEIEQQVKRLQHHPSIAIWAGNNENEAALVQNWYNTSHLERQYKADYLALYVKTIMPITKNVDPGRMYLTSSPSNGIETMMEGYISEDPQSSLYGDRHHYDYFKNGWLSYNYPPARFCSEYGFQSLPSMSALEKVSGANDSLLMGKEFMNHRQHLPGGYLYMFTQIHHNIKLALKRCCKLEEFIYLSQLNQAWSMKIETETYRQGRGILTPSGEGHTMGALYWQLNDVWVAPSWSSIEYDGKWKMLHYYAKNFFAPVLVSARQMKSGNISLYVISDLLEDIPNCKIVIDVQTWDSFAKEQSRIISNFTVKNATSEAVDSFTLKSLLADSIHLHFQEEMEKTTENAALANKTKNAEEVEERDEFSEKYFLHLQLYGVDGKLISQNFVLPQGFLNITGFSTANVTVTPLTSEKILAHQDCPEKANAKRHRWGVAESTSFIINLIERPDNENYPLLLPYDNIRRLTAEVKDIKEVDERTSTIILQTTRIAAFVWLETTIPGRFSDNGFMMIDPYHQVNFTSDSNINVDDFKNNLNVTNLRDNY